MKDGQNVDGNSEGRVSRLGILVVNVSPCRSRSQGERGSTLQTGIGSRE